MTKTPEELTEDWLNNKLQAGSFWFVEIEDDSPKLMVVDIDGDFDDYTGNYYMPGFSKGKLKVLAPCNYDEYKAMQEQIADASKKVEELEEKIKDKEELIQCLGSDIDYLNTKKMILIVENNKLRGLLKECLPIVSAEIMTWQIRGGEESRKRGQDLLTRINAALGESEE